MTRPTRLLLAMAAVAVFVAIALPLWEVRLVAPQYPEGLGLRILSHTVRGLGPNDLNSINMLNHYIGMKPIEPDSIPELRFMPWLMVALGTWLLVIAWRGGRRQLLVWLGVLVVAGVVGLWDFWRWEYDYGHNLDLDTAVIIVPGMSYQPPIIGSTQLLNFTATAWPGVGAMLLGAAGFLAAIAWWSSRPRRRGIAQIGAAALLAVTTACSGRVPQIALDLDACDYCRMIISDARYVAAATTSSGRTVRFDSVECLASWVVTQEEAPRAVWVTDVGAPGGMLQVRDAVFYRDAVRGSPMGRGWQASAISAGPEGALTWDALLDEIRVELKTTPARQERH
jgi:copper chaperone NosL